MLHDRHLYTVHKVPVRFQRCLACMVAKQGPCGDHKATWLCRSRLTDAPPGVNVQNGVNPAQLVQRLNMASVHARRWQLLFAWHLYGPSMLRSAFQALEIAGVEVLQAIGRCSLHS